MNPKDLLAKYWKENKIASKEVIKAFLSVPREEFVLDEYKNYAYDDRPLPIISGQTISQPSTVIIMTTALEVKAGNKILEVGAGSGYQAAILSKLVGIKGKIISLEIISELANFARNKLNKLGIKNVEVINMDGGEGYAKETPYDRIIVTAASKEILSVWIEQLKENGILLAPVGDAYSQEMIKLRKKKRKIETELLGKFMFVPLTGKIG